MISILTTTILLTIWAGLFSQQLYNQQKFQENRRSRPDTDLSHITGKSNGTKVINPANFQTYIEAWLVKANCPGMSICVLRNGDLFWKSHAGFANIEENEPVNDSSCFLIASVSKPIVQTVSMKLWEQGYFDLYDDINASLPFTVIHPNPAYSDSVITFFQLMTHTSSIKHNYNLVASYTVWGSDPPIPLGEWLEGYLIPGGTYYQSGNWWTFPPNHQWEYSNMGCSLLAYIMEYISGQDFDEYCIENVFGPLGIGNAAFLQNNIDTTYLVTPYEHSNGSYIPWPQPGDPNYPSGSLKISALDLSKFLGMYMKQGTYNDTTILNPETIELITTPTSIVTPADYGEMCFNWFYSNIQNFTHHTGGWTIPPIAGTLMGYDKDDQWGIICFQNTYVEDDPWFEMADNLAYFAKNYDPFSVVSVSVDDENGNHIIEANEEFSLNLNIRNNINIADFAENIVATISVNSPYISLISDSVVSIGTLYYLDEFQLQANQFIFLANENLEPEDIEFKLHFSWNNEKEYTTSVNLFGGLADVLVVCDETSLFVSEALQGPQEWYLEALDSLGFVTHFYNLEMMENPTQEFINNFPAVIWFTGYDSLNTVSVNNQDILAGYLDNGGQLFLSGQNISDELAGTAFLQNYLYVEHIEDTWTGPYIVKGIENDTIGDGMQFHIHGGDGLANQYSMSIVEPLGDAHKVFSYYPNLEGAAVRYENNTYKSIFFAFGFEAIRNSSDRYEIMNRILNDYFVMPHPCLPDGITFSTQEEIDNFQINYPGCIEIEGDVTISGSEILNLDGLNVLTSIWGDLSVEDNEILDSLTGLDNLTSIGGSLTIFNNDSLISLSGIDNLDNASITDLIIANNNSLYDCDIWTICQYLIAPGGEVDIHDNAPGCNNIEEVEEHCLTKVEEYVSVNKLNIYPNPLGLNTLITYTLENSSLVTLKILDLSGRSVVTLVNKNQHLREQKVIFNTETLKPGVYFCTLKTNDGMQTIKMIKL